uniref:Uncharacterized protein n=1 Tax=viral metagenome TaxID=1070528 RepID=A0A6M3KUX7_9ZZZZ
MNIEEIKEKKAKLEEAACKAFNKFEAMTGMEVKEVHIYHSYQLIDPSAQAVRIEIGL